MAQQLFNLLMYIMGMFAKQLMILPLNCHKMVYLIQFNLKLMEESFQKTQLIILVLIFLAKQMTQDHALVQT